MTFLNALQQTTNETLTENGAVSNLSTLDPLLDFFARAGAMRDDVGGAVKLFEKAYASDPLMATKALFYLRDIRGGQGERDIFRACLPVLYKLAKSPITHYVPEYGRWDDLLSLPIPAIVPLIKTKLSEDEKNMVEGKSVSLLAKWMPSENTSSEKTTKLAKQIMEAMGLTPRQYRKKIVTLRKYIKLLEQQMSANEWGDIDYEKIPSQAHRKHVKAFNRHDESRYSQYLSEVEKGEKKIKTSTLYTYEVFDMIEDNERAANVMWDNLPDYTNGSNALVMADVSGSMSGRPMSISVSLALYFAERNKGTFNGYFMTFSEKPHLVKVSGATLAQKLGFIERADWDQNTDVEAAFKAILNAAIRDKTPQEQMPAVLYIISDMEFDEATDTGKTNFETAKAMFEAAGYKLPHVVFWNVNSRNQQVPATKFDAGVTLISGSSQSTFKYAVEGKSPMESMVEVLNSERYAQIKI